MKNEPIAAPINRPTSFGPLTSTTLSRLLSIHSTHTIPLDVHNAEQPKAGTRHLRHALAENILTSEPSDTRYDSEL